VDLNILLNDALISGVTGADTLTGSDPKAANSWENPHAVEPKTLEVQLKEDGSVTAGLPPLSFTAIKGAIRDR
jgi:alpha-L-arabinofuranosidase